MGTLRDAVYGAAIGDALGVPFEFKARDSFECSDMVGQGTYGLPAGTFSDDTSMMLATCDSIRELAGRIDTDDMRERFRHWWRNGAYTADGSCFDIGNTTAIALDEGYGCSGERDNGNGSLMRIAPLAYCDANDDDVRAVSAITHAHRVSTESCVFFVELLRRIINGDITDVLSMEEVVCELKPTGESFAFLDTVVTWQRGEVRSSGFVLDTLGAALWCFANTDSYADCVLAAVNLGSDTDTTACVAGALAGAFYGIDAIPARWMESLRGKEIIEACLF
ncbi:MAG: ADP-ribosylglycohydrolase family protein [Eggerthellaceae bacterium]|nr:ADP-ribosylglycohydrolase family protein [Eggerthellaceae bacterium]